MIFMHFIFLSFIHIFNLTSRKRFLNMRSFRLHAFLFVRIIYGAKPRNSFQIWYIFQIDIQIYLIFVKAREF